MSKESATYTFFPGCRFAHQESFKQTRERTRDLFKFIGVSLTSLPETDCRCSGYPLLTLNCQAFRTQAQELAPLEAPPLVSSCPLCCVALRASQGESTLHTVQVLADHTDRLRRLDLKSDPVKVTYHDPCYLSRGLGVIEEPRRILASLPGVTLVEMGRNRENTFCCGMGGGVEHTFAEMVEPIARERMAEAKRTGTATCVATCVTCCPPCVEALAPVGHEVGIEVVDLAGC